MTILEQAQPKSVMRAVERVTSECPAGRCSEDHLYDFCRHWRIGLHVHSVDWRTDGKYSTPSKAQRQLNSVRIQSRIA